jgi:hypothetical protein
VFDSMAYRWVGPMRNLMFRGWGEEECIVDQGLKNRDRTRRCGKQRYAQDVKGGRAPYSAAFCLR